MRECDFLIIFICLLGGLFWASLCVFYLPVVHVGVLIFFGDLGPLWGRSWGGLGASWGGLGASGGGMREQRGQRERREWKKRSERREQRERREARERRQSEVERRERFADSLDLGGCSFSRLVADSLVLWGCCKAAQHPRDRTQAQGIRATRTGSIDR